MMNVSFLSLIDISLINPVTKSWTLNNAQTNERLEQERLELAQKVISLFYRSQIIFNLSIFFPLAPIVYSMKRFLEKLTDRS